MSLYSSVPSPDVPSLTSDLKLSLSLSDRELITDGSMLSYFKLIVTVFPSRLSGTSCLQNSNTAYIASRARKTMKNAKCVFLTKN